MPSTQKKSNLATALALTGLGSDASDVHLGRGWSDGLDNLHPISMFSPFPFGVEKDNGIFKGVNLTDLSVTSFVFFSPVGPLLLHRFSPHCAVLPTVRHRQVGGSFLG